MYQNKKFEKTAQRRKYFAIMAALVLHLAVIAAVSSKTDLKELMPDFVKGIFAKNTSPQTDVPVP